MISGGTGAGKTTLLNALSAAVPATERIITVEDNAELRLQQPHVVTLEARPSNVEGRGEISIRDLVRNSLRMRPDRIIVGEVRGGETLDMLQALNTGHEGSLVTVHANSCDDAIHRLETLATMSDLHIPFEALRDQINSAIHVIVQIDRFADGARRISEVAAVASERREDFRLGTVVRFETDPIGPDRKVTGSFRHFPLPPGIAEHLRLQGERVPAGVRPGRRGRRARPSGRPPDGEGRRRAPAAAVRAGAGDARRRPVRHRLLAPGRAGRARARRQRRRRGHAPAPVLRRLAAAAPERPPARQLAAGRRLAAVARRPAAAVRLGDAVPDASCCRCSCRCGVAFLFAVVGVAVIARVLVERKRGQRRDEFIDQLPDVARVLSNGTSAGLSMAGAMELAARELAQPAATEMEVVVQETRLGMPLESSLERLRDRLPSREVAVLMTTLIIQQRAGGDTVRALSELGQTLEARKDLLREIRTMLSGAVFTSYLVAMMGAGTLVLVNLISPGIMRELTTTLPGILALLAGRDPLRRRVRDHPRASPRWRHDAAARRASARPRACSSALLAIPMLRDRGPIDRLRARAATRDRGAEGSALRRLFEWLDGAARAAHHAAHARLQARVDRPPPGPRRPPRRR